MGNTANIKPAYHCWHVAFAQSAGVLITATRMTVKTLRFINRNWALQTRRAKFESCGLLPVTEGSFLFQKPSISMLLYYPRDCPADKISGMAGLAKPP